MPPSTQEHAARRNREGDCRLYDEGKIKPVVFGTFGLDGDPNALRQLGGRRTYGKVIITP